nr:unnamed protein product [Callosobruchus analis]
MVFSKNIFRYQRLPSHGNRSKWDLRANRIFLTAMVPSTGSISLLNVQQAVLPCSTTTVMFAMADADY